MVGFSTDSSEVLGSIEFVEAREYGVIVFSSVKKSRWSFSSQSAGFQSETVSKGLSPPMRHPSTVCLACKLSCLGFALRPLFGRSYLEHYRQPLREKALKSLRLGCFCFILKHACRLLKIWSVEGFFFDSYKIRLCSIFFIDSSVVTFDLYGYLCLLCS